jgi:hypothetical protein
VKPKNALIFLLILFSFIGGVSGFFAAREVPEPKWWPLISGFLLSITIFYWYHMDSTERSFKRSLLLNIGVIGVAPIGVPIYMYRRSERGTRLRSLSRMIGYTILSFLAAIAGGMAGGLLAGLIA